MPSTIALRYTYRIDWQEPVRFETAAEAFRALDAALKALAAPASGEINDTWTGAHLAGFARKPNGQIIDVPF